MEIVVELKCRRLRRLHVFERCSYRYSSAEVSKKYYSKQSKVRPDCCQQKTFVVFFFANVFLRARRQNSGFGPSLLRPCLRLFMCYLYPSPSCLLDCGSSHVDLFHSTTISILCCFVTSKYHVSQYRFVLYDTFVDNLFN